jgi:hypothetical protein
MLPALFGNTLGSGSFIGVFYCIFTYRAKTLLISTEFTMSHWG